MDRVRPILHAHIFPYALGIRFGHRMSGNRFYKGYLYRKTESGPQKKTFMKSDGIDRIIPLLIDKRERLAILAGRGNTYPGLWRDSSTTFSTANPYLNRNFRSYFDRWRNMRDTSGLILEPSILEPSWRLDRPSPTAPASKPIPSCCYFGVTRYIMHGGSLI